MVYFDFSLISAIHHLLTRKSAQFWKIILVKYCNGIKDFLVMYHEASCKFILLLNVFYSTKLDGEPYV